MAAGRHSRRWARGRTGNGGVQPRPGRSARQRRGTLLGGSGYRPASHDEHEPRQGGAVLHRIDRIMLVAEPARPLRRDRQVAGFAGYLDLTWWLRSDYSLREPPMRRL